MAASRRLYEDIAESFRIAYRQASPAERMLLFTLMRNLCVDFAKDNPRFNCNTFEEKCIQDYPTGVKLP